MKRLVICLSAGLVALGVLGLSVLQGAEAKPLKTEKEWDGTFPDNADLQLIQEAPRGGHVANAQDFAKLWKAWRGKEELPKVDFDKELVFACAAPCHRNKITAEFRLDDKGDLSARFSATEIGGPGFVYKIVTVKREGVKTINGKEIAK
jgi:hypothetical protein